MKPTSAQNVAARFEREIIDAIDAHAPFSRSVFLRLAVVEKLERDYGVKLSPACIRGGVQGRRTDLVDPSPEKMEQMRQQASHARASRWKNHHPPQNK